MTERAQKSRSWRHRLGWLLAELLVIFVGVYAAFLLDNYQAHRRMDFRRQQIHAAFAEEFSVLSRAYRQGVPVLDSLITAFLSDYERGHMPKPMRLHLAIGSQSSVWDAAVQSGALEILDVDLIFQLSSYYSFKNLVNDEFISFRRLTEQYVLPNLDKRSEEFYHTETKEFKEKYRWYLDSMRILREYTHRVQEMTDSLLADIQRYTELENR